MSKPRLKRSDGVDAVARFDAVCSAGVWTEYGPQNHKQGLATPTTQRLLDLQFAVIQRSIACNFEGLCNNHDRLKMVYLVY